MKRISLIVAIILMVSSCGTSAILTRGSLYPEMYEEDPLVLLVMPPINYTSNVEAKDLLYTSINRPLIEAGYYVIPPLLAMEVLKAESAYDSELFVDGSLAPFKSYFGADAVVFSEIHSWNKSGFGIQTTLRYFIKSTHSGDILFDRTCDLYLDLSVNSGSSTTLSLLIDLAASAISTAATDHIVAARKANYYIFKDIPRGKYSSVHQQDKDYMADTQNISARVQ